MILNERKIRILEAIINDYIETAEPIGSRTIAKKYDLGVSSATIRNEMSDLEELGLIVQPHTSSGRVPSSKGYRLYVDRLMNRRELTREQSEFLQDVITQNINQIDYLMKQTAKALSAMTKYTTVVSEPKTKKTAVKHIQLVPLDEKSIIAVIVTENKVIKNQVIKLDSVPEIDELNKISNVVNDIIKSYSPEQIKKDMSRDLSESLGKYEMLIKAVFKAVFEVIREEEEVSFYTSGVNNILDFPEFADLEKAKGLFKALEEKETLIDLLDKNASNNDSQIQILIGDENDTELLKDCSIIKTKYTVGNAVGTIGIIGPTRMDYAQTVAVLNAIVKNINDVIRALSSGG